MNEKGQSLVEFAISLTLIILLLSGVVEFATAFFQFVQLRDSAQEGALYGSFCNCNITEVESRILGSSNSPLDLNDTNVSIQIRVFSGGTEKPFANRCEADSLEVRVTYLHKMYMPFLPQLLGIDYLPLNASVTNTVLTPTC